MARRAINATREAMDAALTFDREDVHRDVSKPKKLVFITGASGMMGGQTLKQLLARPNRFKVRALLRPSDKNRVFAKKHMCPALEVVWGDMSDYDTIKKCVDGCDYVLHIGAMVSPAADKYPEETLYTNIGSTLNIIKAIKEQPDPDKVHLAYVGTVDIFIVNTSPATSALTSCPSLSARHLTMKWRGDLTFSQDAFNEVDNLLLSYVAYVNLEGLSVGAGEEQVTLEDWQYQHQNRPL